MQNFIPNNPDYQNSIAEKMKANHFMNFIGFKTSLVQPGLIEGNLTILKEHTQQIGFLHGGVIATLVDLVAGFAAYTLVKPGDHVVTVEMKVVYLNPGIGQTAFAKGYVIKAGNRLHFSESEIWVNNNGVDTLVAKGYATFAVINLV